MLQLQLFPEPIEETHQRKIEDLEKKYLNLVKSLHARIGTLTKKNDDLEGRLERLESHLLCSNGFLL